MNDKKICFIMCVNDRMYEEECIRYIKKLNIPEGYEIEQRSVWGAKSMAEGYNKAMQKSDAKYKVYLHQDVFIVNKNFIYDMLDVFAWDEKIGLMGMVGVPKIPTEAVMWSDKRIGTIFTSNIIRSGPAFFGEVQVPYEQVEAVDGLLMATQVDLLWRQDAFQGWDFYDLSQSMELRKNGYKVVVPAMQTPWCLHDDGYIKFDTYFKWRDVFLKEYGDMLHETDK